MMDQRDDIAIVKPSPNHVSSGTLSFGSRVFPCTLGKNGIVTNKKEGDNGTPAGVWPIRRIFYRSDKIKLPHLAYETAQISKNDGWCDAISDPEYNKHVALPYNASTESLWRDDDLYDLIVILGYNDFPVVPGAGSAIFAHVSSPVFGPTAGCIGLKIGDLISLLSSERHPKAFKIEE